MQFDFESMRDFIAHLHASLPIKRYRLQLFDMYRYTEDYEKLYEFFTMLGGIIE